ncbi:unnamed protein product [Paramecium octaurelia]|uniref:Uncharacterized protein n=1 Tax=Paramecium octaurelia TaxID=43137 RepID=A0A8S1W7W2_PAROT|nr:unnamed protein product [Paramecium octaurelia]
MSLGKSVKKQDTKVKQLIRDCVLGLGVCQKNRILLGMVDVQDVVEF